MRRLLLLGLLLIITNLLLACGPDPRGALAPAPPSTKCPAPGTEVSLGQMTNIAFAPDFVGCHVKTKATFQAPNGGAPEPPGSGVVTFQIMSPGGGLVLAKINKESAAALFDLKPGDPVVLTGGTQVTMGWAFFMADSIAKGQ